MVRRGHKSLIHQFCSSSLLRGSNESVSPPERLRWLPEQYVLESVQTGHNTASGNLPVSVDPVAQSSDSVRHAQVRY